MPGSYFLQAASKPISLASWGPFQFRAAAKIVKNTFKSSSGLNVLTFEELVRHIFPPLEVPVERCSALHRLTLKLLCASIDRSQRTRAVHGSVCFGRKQQRNIFDTDSSLNNFFKLRTKMLNFTSSNKII